MQIKLKKFAEKWQKYNNDDNIPWEPLINQFITQNEHLGLLKIELTLDCKAESFFKLFSDIQPVTRFRWDKGFFNFGLGNISRINILREIEDNFHYIEYEIIPENANLKHCHLQGLHYYSKKSDIVLFLTQQEVPCPKDLMPVSLSFGCIIRELVPEKQMYFRMILMDINIPKMDHSMFLKQCKFIVKLTSEVNKIYDLFQCKYCRDKWLPAHLLECPNCKIERFGRCLDVNCFIPVDKDVEKCPKCKGQINK